MGFIVVISWKWVGNCILVLVCEIIILFDFNGWCNVFNILCLNFGSLFKNKMLLWVSDILLGFGIVFLLINVIIEVLWWGVWNGWFF